MVGFLGAGGVSVGSSSVNLGEGSCLQCGELQDDVAECLTGNIWLQLRESDVGDAQAADIAEWPHE
jgi:hypothetical protein